MLSQQRIREWYDHWQGGVYVSFSGGKDSTVLLHLVRELYPEVPAVFVDTGLEYPEVRKFALSQPNVTVLRPELRFDKVIEQYGYPLISKEVSKCIYEARMKPDGYMASFFQEGSYNATKHDGRYSKVRYKW